MNELLKTSEVADRLGVKPATIRSWFHRYPGLFQEGIHYTQDQRGDKLWTPAAMELFQTRATQTETQIAPLSVSSDVADCNHPIDEQLQPIAESIAYQVIEQRLPVLVNQVIDRLLANPSDLDNQRLNEVLDRVGTGLGLVRMSEAIAGGLRAALAASTESMKSLPGGN